MRTNDKWWDESFNPITGCTPISEGCEHCYAARMAKRLAGRFGYPPADPFRPGVLHWDLHTPLKWKQPKHIFVCSMGDFFHERVNRANQELVLQVMRDNPQHTYIMLTKRPENALWLEPEMLPPHFWFGVTVESASYRKRAHHLKQIPASVRFVSCEPCLGPVYLSLPLERINWVIVGGETGPGARPMDPAWARYMKDICKDFKIPFFFKQMGGGRPTPPDLEIREFPQ